MRIYIFLEILYSQQYLIRLVHLPISTCLFTRLQQVVQIGRSEEDDRVLAEQKGIEILPTLRIDIFN